MEEDVGTSRKKNADWFVVDGPSSVNYIWLWKPDRSPHEHQHPVHQARQSFDCVTTRTSTFCHNRPRHGREKRARRFFSYALGRCLVALLLVKELFSAVIEPSP